MTYKWKVISFQANLGSVENVHTFILWVTWEFNLRGKSTQFTAIRCYENSHGLEFQCKIHIEILSYLNDLSCFHSLMNFLFSTQIRFYFYCYQQVLDQLWFLIWLNLILTEFNAKSLTSIKMIIFHCRKVSCWIFN
jgi:hypothetical protein